MKSMRLLAALATVSVIAWACSSKSDDTAPDGSAGKSTTGGKNGTAGKSSGGTANEAGAPEGGTTSTGGDTTSTGGDATSSGGDTAPGGAPGTAGMTGDAGSGPTCDASVNFQHDPENCGHCGHSCAGGECSGGQCEPVLVIDSGRTIRANVTYDPGNAVLVDQGSIYFWNNGYKGLGDYEYTILKASVVPTTPPSDGTPALQSFLGDGSKPVTGVTFDAGYFYYAQKTGATTAAVMRKKLDTSDGTGAGAKLFSLDDGRIWRSIAIAGNKLYITGEVDTNLVDLIKTGIYSLTLPPANVNAKPVAITGLANLDERISDLTVVGGHLFWLQYDEATTHNLLWTAPVAGGTPVMLDDVRDFVGSSITGDAAGQYVYWSTHFHGGKVARCPIATLDTDHIEPLTEANNNFEGLFVDDQYVYYGEAETLVTGKPIWRVAKEGGAPELLGELDGAHQVVGVDKDFVYVEDFDSLIYRLPNTP
jgi:hypothetical protein